MHGVANFKKDLEYSNLASDEQFWIDIYKKAFYQYSHYSTTIDLVWQKQGVDRIIYLKNGKSLSIDEKKRRRVYNDILIEYKSNSNKSINDGWINKDLSIDYIAYGFMPEKIAYLIEWQGLKRAWLQNGKQWFKNAKNKINGFRIVTADNKLYLTYSIAVPKAILFEAIKNSMEIKL